MLKSTRFGMSRALMGTLLVAMSACGGDARDEGDTSVGDDVAVADVAVDIGVGDDSAVMPDVSDDVPVDDVAVADVAVVDTAGDADDVAADTSPDVATPASCLDFASAGERYSVGDNCNFCTCNDDGSSTCTNRLCRNEKPSCTYDGVEYPYAARFSATDGCNVCVCATSGLACTRRCPDLPQEGAILLESLDEACGDDVNFTAQAVLDGLPSADLQSTFFYERKRDFYPETRPDTTGRIRILYEGGHAVCRIPMPTQPAIDIEAVVEFTTADGAFDEGLHTYLRRNNFGFVDAWHVHAGWPVDGLDGDYDPNCLLPNGFAFMVQVNADGSYLSDVLKVCEESIAVPVGRLEMLVAE